MKNKIREKNAYVTAKEIQNMSEKLEIPKEICAEIVNIEFSKRLTDLETKVILIHDNLKLSMKRVKLFEGLIGNIVKTVENITGGTTEILRVVKDNLKVKKEKNS